VWNTGPYPVAAGATLRLEYNVWVDAPYNPNPYLNHVEADLSTGGPIWDDDTKTWLVVKDVKKGVLGFVAVASRNGRVMVESLWTQPGMDRVASELVGAATARFGATALHAVTAPQYGAAYRQAGFTQSGTRGRFFTREASDGR
jgi:hypothetical protein